jgi:hypothetical protein
MSDMKIFDSGELPIISGQGEAIKNVYDVHRGESGFLWLVPSNIKSKADHIYVQGKNGSDGFGGATLNFDISHGDSISLSGAWKTGPGALLKDTGIDLTNTFSTFVVVGRRRIHPPNSYMRGVIEDVVYQDGDWTIGSYDRGMEMAKSLVKELNETLYLYRMTQGGAMGRQITPEQAAE